MTSATIVLDSNSPEGRRILLKRAKVATIDIAKEAGVTASTVRSIVNGFGRSYRVEAAIARLLNMPYDQLFSAVKHTRPGCKSEPRYPEGHETMGGQ